MTFSFDAVILAGGRGSRLGGVSKADLIVGGVRLLDRVLEATEGASTKVVVGRVEVPDGVLLTLEDPPGTGPCAGIVAGLDAVSSPAEWTLVLACDLPDATPAVATLLEAVAAETDEGVEGYTVAGREGEAQWLLGLYRSTAIRRAAYEYGDPRNRSVRRMLAPLRLKIVGPGGTHAEDIDTWADHARWNAHLRGRTRMKQPEDKTPWRPFIEAACAAVGLIPGWWTRAILVMTREITHAGRVRWRRSRRTSWAWRRTPRRARPGLPATGYRGRRERRPAACGSGRLGAVRVGCPGAGMHTPPWC